MNILNMAYIWQLNRIKMQLINIKKLCEFQRWIQTFQREEAIYIFGGSKNGKIYLKKNPPKIQVKGRVNPPPSWSTEFLSLNQAHIEFCIHQIKLHSKQSKTNFTKTDNHSIEGKLNKVNTAQTIYYTISDLYKWATFYTLIISCIYHEQV